MSLLKTIHSPCDLKRIPVEQLPALCQEIREQIIATVSSVGGHLGSNLGVVELTVALHLLLDAPKDKIVWDTSNQAYTHKLLTQTIKELLGSRSASKAAKRRTLLSSIMNRSSLGDEQGS